MPQGLDLLSLTSGAIGVVNPYIAAAIKISTGYATVNFKQVPSYRTVNVLAQVQSLTYKDLQQIEGLNLNGTRRAIYLRGEFDATVRFTKSGGDLVTIYSGVNKGDWLVAQVLEQWPNWCKVAVTLQNGS